MRLFFVRHGETEWNAVRRLQGRWDSDLSDLGRRQAGVNASLLAGLEIEALFSSPATRARQTAEIIGERLGLTVAYDERILEWDCGDWSGHLEEDVIRRWPLEWDALMADPFHYRVPNGENYPDMVERARPFLSELAELDARSVAIVSHGMIGKVMIAILLGLDEQETLSVHQPNDVVFGLTTGPAGPDPHHYRAGGGPVPGFTSHETGD